MASSIGSCRWFPVEPRRSAMLLTLRLPGAPHVGAQPTSPGRGEHRGLRRLRQQTVFCLAEAGSEKDHRGHFRKAQESRLGLKAGGARCRMHGGADGSGAPKGEKNGNYSTAGTPRRFRQLAGGYERPLSSFAVLSEVAPASLLQRLIRQADQLVGERRLYHAISDGRSRQGSARSLAEAAVMR
jgi:hypothetical protein